MPPDVRAALSVPERLGLDALSLRQSRAYVSAKAKRKHAGADWDSGVAETPACHDITIDDHDAEPGRATMAGAPTSARLTGSIAVGIVIVEGPTAALKFSAAERTKVVAEVQNGLGWLGSQSPAGVSWVYDIRIVTLAVPSGPDSLNSSQREALWRDPAMAQLGFGAGMAGVTAYVESIRTAFNTTWGYCGFFTKYPLGHFAYASIGGPRLVMDYNNDGWGPDNIDRVFAHETGHVFGAPDEYAASNCNCGGSWGFYGKPNTNCANCAPSGGVDCIMKQNSWAMCPVTPYHLGFPLVEQTYSGVWRQGTDAHYLWVNASWDSFVAKWQELAGQNLRLVDLKITREAGSDRFHGVWRQGTGGYYLWVNASWDSFVAKWQELAGQNLRLVDLEVTQSASGLRYSGVWLPGSDGYYLWVNASWESFVAKWQELARANLRLVDLKIVNVNGADRYFGVWRQGTGAYYLWVKASWQGFVAKWQELAQQNLRLVDLEITASAGGPLYSGVWLPGSDGYYLWAGASWQNFKAKWEELSAQNLRLVDLEVVPAEGPQSAVPAVATATTGPARVDVGGLAPQPSHMPAGALAYAGRAASYHGVLPDRPDGFGGGDAGGSSGAGADGMGGGEMPGAGSAAEETDGMGGGDSTGRAAGSAESGELGGYGAASGSDAALGGPAGDGGGVIPSRG